ncbi:unnamed protein product, partial [marine sediment metagenome]
MNENPIISVQALKKLFFIRRSFLSLFSEGS